MLAFPRGLINVKMRNGMLKVTDVGETVRTQWTEFGELVVRPKDFLNVCKLAQKGKNMEGRHRVSHTASCCAIWNDNLPSDGQ